MSNLLDTIERHSRTVFSEGHFAEPGVFTPAGGQARSVTGIFDRVSELSDIGEIIEADGVGATYNVHAADFADAAIGDALTVRGYDYRVVGLEPDGTGRTVMVLGV